MALPRRWDIFCRVVDNFGDAGVCWRLACDLVAGHGARVCLWIDDLGSLHRLNPAAADVERQEVEGVEVRHWGSRAPDEAPQDVVIEAFGCGLPDEYVEAMARASRRPLWIVLEYLSAEPWVREHHALPSPHPRWPLDRYFFFPGFVESTGGLLREADLFARRDRFSDAQREAFWRSVGHAAPPAGAITVSLFAYESAPLGELLQSWEEGAQPVVAAVSEGRALAAALGHFGVAAIPADRIVRSGALEMRVIPFVPQVRYDELLWSCDCNFVRGEDSFVRAQWAARPFVWQIYPQEARAHWRKLQAFLDLYCEALPETARDVLTNLSRVWNHIDVPGVTPASAWAAFLGRREEIHGHAARWATRMAALGGLSENLARFCQDKLK